MYGNKMMEELRQNQKADVVLEPRGTTRAFSAYEISGFL